MYYFCDYLILLCLYFSGFHFGYYCKFTYFYDNFLTTYYAGVAIPVILLLSVLWCFRKYKNKYYSFENFYIIFYGVICSLISSVFFITNNEDKDIAFYFMFIAMVVIYLPCFNYISLRSDSNGQRPMHIGIGNTLYFAGITTGFSLYNEFESEICGWILLGLSILLITGLIVNEVLHKKRYQNYKKSNDLVYNLLNDEKLIYANRKSIMALFVGREHYIFKRNLQWLIVGIAVFLVLERSTIFSWTYLSLTISATQSYTQARQVYMPCLLYTIGCGLGSALMYRYKPKLIYLMFGIIKITITAAILGVYNERFPENCFVFLCFYYSSMGVYSSVVIQMLVECCPFVYTEIALAIAYSLELALMELMQLERPAADNWFMLLILSVATICLTFCCITIVQFLLPESKGLIEIRNKLLGIHRLPTPPVENKLWKNNFFLQFELPANMKNVELEKDRVFQQYPNLETKF